MRKRALGPEHRLRAPRPALWDSARDNAPLRTGAANRSCALAAVVPANAAALPSGPAADVLAVPRPAWPGGACTRPGRRRRPQTRRDAADNGLCENIRFCFSEGPYAADLTCHDMRRRRADGGRPGPPKRGPPGLRRSCLRRAWCVHFACARAACRVLTRPRLSRTPAAARFAAFRPPWRPLSAPMVRSSPLLRSGRCAGAGRARICTGPVRECGTIVLCALHRRHGAPRERQSCPAGTAPFCLRVWLAHRLGGRSKRRSGARTCGCTAHLPTVAEPPSRPSDRPAPRAPCSPAKLTCVALAPQRPPRCRRCCCPCACCSLPARGRRSLSAFSRRRPTTRHGHGSRCHPVTPLTRCFSVAAVWHGVALPGSVKWRLPLSPVAPGSLRVCILYCFVVHAE